MFERLSNNNYHVVTQTDNISAFVHTCYTYIHVVLQSVKDKVILLFIFAFVIDLTDIIRGRLFICLLKNS